MPDSKKALSDIKDTAYNQTIIDEIGRHASCLSIIVDKIGELEALLEQKESKANHQDVLQWFKDCPLFQEKSTSDTGTKELS